MCDWIAFKLSYCYSIRNNFGRKFLIYNLLTFLVGVGFEFFYYFQFETLQSAPNVEIYCWIDFKLHNNILYHIGDSLPTICCTYSFQFLIHNFITFSGGLTLNFVLHIVTSLFITV